MASITYNSLDLQDTTYRTEAIEHIEQPRRRIESLERARRHGETFVSGWYGPRRIRVKGHIVAASEAAFKTALDDLQKALNSEGANLDVGIGGGTRRYPDAVCERQRLPKERYHNKFAPYELIFLVPGGFGEDTSATTVSESNITSSPDDQALNLTGSADPVPTITVTFNSATTATILKIKNVTTGEEIIVGPDASSFTGSDVVEVDCDAQTVKLNGTEKDYTGVFPRWQPGSNTLRITVTAAAFDIDSDFVYTPRYL